ncbi:TetR/AcrR family transcriptional regulator [Novosphingobium sp. PC22D]|uniref:TetR/AcrR family transcriptional regulator n=1 Tax=Novosphingobium sp. PC22D TaxID=1962403 RepID=UPI000BF0B1AE|nr:TetR/AcrR family transcriptional regulator [Novosphingobium sp. PC22D]
MRTRKAMLAAMLALLAERRFEDIQITDLTQRAGVGYATFFRHFADLRAALEEVAGEEIRALLAMTIPVMRQGDPQLPSDGLASSTRALCQFVDARRALWRTLLTGGARDTVRAEFVRQAREWASRYSLPEARVPIDLGTVCCAGSTIDALAWWLEEGADFTPEAFADYIDRLIILPFLRER